MSFSRLVPNLETKGTSRNAQGLGRTAGQYEPLLLHPVRQIGERTLDFRRQVALITIINRTPDSFYDAGRTFALDAAVGAAVNDGADWVDIGGVPFAPGPAVEAAEEVARVVPVIEAVRARNSSGPSKLRVWWTNCA
ncbi:dihydropteroate synthase [Arthrobacter gengyunqii]|uniref:dihydropteroate synthase n=1 Tax=Arthrobacter gengyunqii TaxID=2886940 RepID=UPI00311A9FDD